MFILTIFHILKCKAEAFMYMALADDPQRVIGTKRYSIEVKQKAGFDPSEYRMKILDENRNFVFKYKNGQLCYSRKKKLKICKTQKLRGTWELVRDHLSYFLRQNGRCVALTTMLEDINDSSELTLKDCSDSGVIKIRFFNLLGEIIEVETDTVLEEGDYIGLRNFGTIDDTHAHTHIEEDFQSDSDALTGATVIHESGADGAATVKTIEMSSNSSPARVKIVKESPGLGTEQKRVRIKRAVSPNSYRMAHSSNKSMKIVSGSNGVTTTHIEEHTPEKTIITRPLTSGITTRKKIITNRGDGTVKTEKVTGLSNNDKRIIITKDHDDIGRNDYVIEKKSIVDGIEPILTTEEADRAGSSFERDDKIFMKDTLDFKKSMEQNLDFLVNDAPKTVVETTTRRVESENCYTDTAGITHCHH